jgi:hypothetical protein
LSSRPGKPLIGCDEYLEFSIDDAAAFWSALRAFTKISADKGSRITSTGDEDVRVVVHGHDLRNREAPVDSEASTCASCCRNPIVRNVLHLDAGEVLRRAGSARLIWTPTDFTLYKSP